MPNFRIPLSPSLDEELVRELEKASAYVALGLEELRVTSDRLAVDVRCRPGSEDEVTAKVLRFVEAIARDFRRLGPVRHLARSQRRDPGPLETSAMAELERRRWVYRLGRGQVGLAGGALALVRQLDTAIAELAWTRFRAREESYPAILPTDVMARCGYFGSFPHSVSFVSHVVEDFDAIEQFREANTDCERLKVPQREGLSLPEVALSPTICLHCYQAYEDATVSEEGTTITSVGKTFRYESRNMAGLHRLWDFTMREIIFLGTERFVEERRAEVVDVIVAQLAEWDVDGEIASATDPFFATVRGAKAMWQQARDLKYEVLLPVEPGPDRRSSTVAACSINLAGNLFGRVFRIRTPDGEAAYTGCVGWGLERCALALFSQHGFEPSRWPNALRRAVFS